MTEAVIVSTVRSPIGRAMKGSLKDIRPDDLSAQMIHALLAKIPQLDTGLIDDLYWGCAEPSGRHGNNLARVVSVLAGYDNIPGATVNRFCASSVQTSSAVARIPHTARLSLPATSDPRRARCARRAADSTAVAS